MTCAKRQVFCELYDDTGALVSVGSNACDNPQEVCPREPGEDYTKCDEICGQQGHAEEVALFFADRLGTAGACFRGKAIIYGHDRVCSACRMELLAAGIEQIELKP